MKTKNRRKVKKKVKIVLVLLVLIGVGLLSYKLVFERKTTSEKSETISSKPLEPKVKIVDELSNTRPIAVMINNISTVWKYQSGLNDAYLVYTMLEEGGITRHMAVFKDTDTSSIQSIRSGRPYYLDYVLENDAIFVHWGGSFQTKDDIKELNIDHIDGLTYEGRYLLRDKSVISAIGSVHSGYTSMELLSTAIEKLGIRSTTTDKVLLKYSATPLELEDATSALKVSTKFSWNYKNNYIYDEARKVYKIYHNDTEMIDYKTKEDFTTKNIIAYGVPYKTIDSENRQQVTTVGTGSAYYITEGKAVEITWEKRDRNSKTIYRTLDGDILKVNDGNTYIDIYPDTYKIEITGIEEGEEE